MSLSIRRMILIMFEEDYQYLPCLREIKEGLIKAQTRQLNRKQQRWNDQTQFNKLKQSYEKKWNLLFNIQNLGDLEKPLTANILSNPNHKITKHLLYIYSMESFIYTELNRVCRDKDKQEIQFYGAFAAAISYIIYFANKRRKDCIKGTTTLYRGIKLTKQQIKQFKVGSDVNLTGYISSSRDRNVAMNFALSDVIEGHKPVLFQIEFKGDKGLFEMSSGFSAFENEDEVLVQDGLAYRVLQNTQLIYRKRHTAEGDIRKEYQLIQLQYPASKQANAQIG